MRVELTALGIGALGIAASLPLAAASPVTFTKDVAPILYQRCAECHRPGQTAPMPLLSFEQARPWAKAIREKVLEGAMPPWLAAPGHGKFENERRLPRREVETLVAWVDGGAMRGNDKDLPPLPKFEEGWTLGKPDAVIALPDEVGVPADGVVPYKYITALTHFTEDHWIQAAEIRPGNRGVVHHVIVFVRDAAAAAAPAASAPPAAAARDGAVRESAADEGGSLRGLVKLAGFAPGEQPKVYPAGTAKLVKAGASLVFQMHYTPNGTAATDRTYIGLFFAREPVRRKVLTATATNRSFVIPAGDANYEVRSSWTAKEDVRIVDLMPHMHYRGKDFRYTAVFPDGRSEVILDVPKYDFNWQLLYRFQSAFVLPQGGRIDCVAHFDNSPRNRYNPDPGKDVRWGPQTWEEMMIGWFDYTLEAEDLTRPAAAALTSPASSRP